MGSNAQQQQQQQGPKHVGGGWYVLPNGNKVQGKAAAQAAWQQAQKGNGRGSVGAPHRLHNLALATASPHGMAQQAAQQAACTALGKVGVQATPGALTAGVWCYTIAQPGGKAHTGYAAKVGTTWHMAINVAGQCYHYKAANFKSIVSCMRNLCLRLAPGASGKPATAPKQVYSMPTSGATAAIPAPVLAARKARKGKGKGAA